MDRRFDQLSPRHRDVLRAAYRGFSTDEIADQLGIKSGTVAGYSTEAVALLSARNRREAARLFHDHELLAPAKNEGRNHGVDQLQPAAPTPPPVDQRASMWGPLSARNWGRDNEFGITARLGWIVATAVVLAVGFLLVVAVVQSVDNLARQHRANQRR